MILTGVDRVLSKLTGLQSSATTAVAKGLNIIAEEVMASSKSAYCPVDTGKLRSTGYVEHAKPSNLVATAGYNANYAIPVHEMNKNYRNGTWKYLETPFKARAVSFQSDLTNLIKGNL